MSVCMKTESFQSAIVSFSVSCFIVFLFRSADAITLVDLNQRSLRLAVDDSLVEARPDRPSSLAFGFKRVYSSQSGFIGLLGVGWCTQLDARIIIYQPEVVRLHACSLITGQSFSTIIEPSALRRVGRYYELHLSDGLIRRFDSGGNLIWTLASEGRQRVEWTLSREPGLRVKIHVTAILSSGGVFQFAIEDKSEIRSSDRTLILRDGKRTDFSYLVKDQLLRAGGRESYEYDAHRNLVRVRGPGLVQSFVYDREDRLIEFRESTLETRQLLKIVQIEDGSESLIEIKMNLERGTEMFPARVIYSRRGARPVIQGNWRALEAIAAVI